MDLSPFRIVSFAALPDWDRDDQLPAFEAFRRSALQVLSKPYRTGSLGVECAAFAAAHDEARRAPPAGSLEARRFFERHFVPASIAPAPARTGFVTGFYEPEVEASPVMTKRFTVPLLSRPPDLVKVDDGNRPPHMDPDFAFARRTPAGLVEYFDRRAIEAGALAGQGLEIAWLADKVDAFFIHVQGAARLLMPDGTSRRVTYAAKSGHRFSGPGRILADLGEIAPADVTMQTIRSWFRQHAGRVDEILQQNRSYIFFRNEATGDASLGPVAAA